MYLIIDEEGGCFTSEIEMTLDDLEAVDEGVMQIINTEDKTIYYDGAWHPLSAWEDQ